MACDECAGLREEIEALREQVHLLTAANTGCQVIIAAARDEITRLRKRPA